MKSDDTTKKPDFRQQIRSLAASATPEDKEIGEKAPKCWDGVWLAIEELYSYSTCIDSCPGRTEDHTIRMLIGRIANEALGVIDCVERGHYDLALIGCRVIYEQHNLLVLLFQDEEALDVFKRGNHSELVRKLSPSKVRKRLRELNAYNALVQEVDELQQELSKRAIHPSLEQLATTHTPGQAIVGPLWQPAGFTLTLNELAFATAAILVVLISQSAFEGEATIRVSNSLDSIADGLGGMRINNLPDSLQHNIPSDRWIG